MHDIVPGTEEKTCKGHIAAVFAPSYRPSILTLVLTLFTLGAATGIRLSVSSHGVVALRM